MRNTKHINLKTIALIGLILSAATGCERPLSEDVELATFPATPEVFIDGFSGGLEYLPFGGSKLDAFTVDDQEFFEGTASMRFDVPNFGDPSGSFAGAIFPDNGGRDLSGFDALTFWARADRSATINEIGFGNDFGENKFVTTKTNLRISTAWTKYIIPIPDPSKLTIEKGLFWYAEGPEDGNGYTFWIDELKYEKLGTIAQPRPAIFDGQDRVEQSFIGINIPITGLTQTHNLADGSNQTVSAAPSYFTFTSSNVSVATVSDLGVVTVVGAGTAEITAILGSVQAAGSLTVESLGDFTTAPVPTRNAADVISLFSDAYENEPVDFYNGFYAPFQTTTSADFSIGGDNILNYQNYNFVGIEFNQNVPTIDATSMTHMHVDIFIPDAFDPASNIRINLVDFGADKSFGGGDDTSVSTVLTTSTSPGLVTGQWISVDFDISSLTTRNSLGQIVFDAAGNFDPRPSAFYVDNLYFYK